MNKIERLVLISTMLDDAGVTGNYTIEELGITQEAFEKVLDMLDDYQDSIDLKALEAEGLEIIKELAGIKQ